MYLHTGLYYTYMEDNGIIASLVLILDLLCCLNSFLGSVHMHVRMYQYVAFASLSCGVGSATPLPDVVVSTYTVYYKYHQILEEHNFML